MILNFFAKTFKFEKKTRKVKNSFKITLKTAFIRESVKYILIGKRIMKYDAN